PGWRSSLDNVWRYSWLNVLLVFVPVSWACHFTDQSPTLTFIMSFIAIVPLAALLGFATEDIALRVGETIGGLLNATFGNAVELIIAILALTKGELDIVQSSMIGSILSNCLLVLGMCFFAGGLRMHEMSYSIRAAQVNLNLLGLAVTAIVIPVAFHVFVDDDANEPLNVTDNKVLQISHGVAIILIVVYIATLVFQLWTHAYMYSAGKPGDPNAPGAAAQLAQQRQLAVPPGEPLPPTEGGVFRIHSLPSLPSLPSWGGSSDDGSSSTSSYTASDDSLDAHTPKMLGRVAILLLVVVTVITGVTAEWLVSSIEGLVETGGVSESFVALILLPLVGNAAEHVTAVTVAAKDKLDLSIAVAVGSSIQIALFVIPVLILLGWCIGQPLTFYFDEFQTVILFVSVVAVNWAIGDGRTNWRVWLDSRLLAGLQARLTTS
ncbi:calcium/proton exchanger, partial [Rhodotorula diobovata]